MGSHGVGVPCSMSWDTRRCSQTSSFRLVQLRRCSCAVARCSCLVQLRSCLVQLLGAFLLSQVSCGQDLPRMRGVSRCPGVPCPAPRQTYSKQRVSWCPGVPCPSPSQTSSKLRVSWCPGVPCPAPSQTSYRRRVSWCLSVPCSSPSQTSSRPGMISVCQMQSLLRSFAAFWPRVRRVPVSRCPVSFSLPDLL